MTQASSTFVDQVMVSDRHSQLIRSVCRQVQSSQHLYISTMAISGAVLSRQYAFFFMSLLHGVGEW